MSTPFLTKDALFGLLQLGEPSAQQIAKARAKQQAKADKAAKEQAKKQGKADQKAALRTSTDKPIYEDTARPALDAAIDAVQALPAAGQALAELRRLRHAAAVLADAGQYSEAVALLKPVESLRAQAVKASAQADKAARKTFAAVFATADALRKDLAAAAALSARDRAALSSEIDTAVAVVHLPDVGASEAAMVTDSLAALRSSVDDAVAAAELARTRGDETLESADALLIALKACATEAEVARIKTLVDGARTLRGEREYGEARDAAAEAVRAGGAIRDAAEMAKAQWDSAAGELAARLAATRALAARRDVPTLHEITPTAQELVEAWQELLADAQTLPGMLGFAHAAQTSERLTAQLADLEERARTDAALRPLRQKAAERVLAATEAVDEQLARLHARVAAFFPDRDEKDLDDPFLDDKAAAEAEWQQCMRRVRSDKALLATCDAICKKLGATCARIDQVIEDVGSFTDAVAERDVALARDAFETARRDCARHIDALLAADAPRGVEQTDLLGALVQQAAQARTPDALQDLTRKAGILAAKTQMQAQKYGADGRKAQARVAEQLASADDKLTTLTALIAEKSKRDWIREPTRERDYGALRDLLREQLDQQRPLARMSEAGILDECEGDLIALNFSIASTIAAIQGGKQAKALNVSSIGSMDDEVAALRERLNKHILLRYTGEAQFHLSESLDQLARALRSIPLEQGRLQLNALDKEIASAELAASAARDAYKKLETEAASLDKAFKDPAFKDAGDYKKALRGEIDRCLKGALGAGTTPATFDALRLIAAKVAQARTDPAACAQGQADADLVARQAAQEAAEWKSRYAIVVAAIADNTTVLTKERAELTQLADSANKAYKTSRDMQAATMQLRIVNDRIDFLRKYPDGMEIAARNKLPKVRDRWKQAVGDLKSGLDTLVDVVHALDPADVPPAAATAVAETVASVKNLFDPVLFDAAVDALSGKRLAKAELSAIREQALRALHGAQAVIATDQRLVDLARNPFQPGIDRLITNASLALAEFETNLLISL